MNFHELSRLPNLFSLSRVIIAPALLILLGRDDTTSVVVASVLFALAGLTDWADGYVARRTGAVTPLGIALDPIADKIFAVVLVLGLIAFREFPIWLAALVVGRDLLILAGGAYLLKRRDGLTLPSNLTGKWAFAALVVLLATYLIRFPFGIQIMTPIASGLLLLSLTIYSRTFVRHWRNQIVEPFADRTAYRIIRVSLAIAVAALLLFRLATDLIR
ncbi:MAG: CDP-alcohol phosphatidyltransferase family protein [Candidatus Zixiibacteriota bacterium]